MPHDTSLITTIVAALVLAFALGALANRLRLPPLVGYLVAGIMVGPYSPGFVADQTLAPQLAEIGVVLLMFGVGLHFSLKDLLAVRSVALPGAFVQIAGTTVLGWGLAALLGWPLVGGLVFGLALSVASTVVLLKALQDRHLVESEKGKLAVGWLIVEDLAMVLALVLIPAIASLAGGTASGVTDPFVSFVERITRNDIGIIGVLVVTAIKLAAFVGFMLVVGRRIIPAILHATAHTGSRELFRLAVLAIALGVAAGSAYLFGVSLALGAFFAGMILSESQLSQRAAQETLPLRDAFAVLFFVSVGMLFDPGIVVRSPLPLLATLVIILVVKAALAFVVVLAFRRPVSTALLIAVSLAQIGEFSFVLAGLGVELNLLPPEGRDLILAGAILSIMLNPLLFWAADRFKPLIEARISHGDRALTAAADAARMEPSLQATEDGGRGTAVDGTVVAEDEEDEVAHRTALTQHTILVGYGRVGSVIASGLQREGLPFVLIEDAENRVHAARGEGIEVIVGNSARGEALALANVEGAKTVLIAIPNAFEAGQTTEQCRRLSPQALIIVRAHSDEEQSYLTHLGADHVILGEREIGLGMLAWFNTQRRKGLSPTVPHEAWFPAGTVERVATVAGTAAVAESFVTPEAARLTNAEDLTDAEDATGDTVEPQPIPEPAVDPVATLTSLEDPMIESTLALEDDEAAPDAFEMSQIAPAGLMPDPASAEGEDLGPAEPPMMVPALGEMPDAVAPHAISVQTGAESSVLEIGSDEAVMVAPSPTSPEPEPDTGEVLLEVIDAPVDMSVAVEPEPPGELPGNAPVEEPAPPPGQMGVPEPQVPREEPPPDVTPADIPPPPELPDVPVELPPMPGDLPPMPGDLPPMPGDVPSAPSDPVSPQMEAEALPMDAEAPPVRARELSENPLHRLARRDISGSNR